MKSLAQQFLPDQDRETIVRTVREMECRTAGEIVPMVVSCSYSYPMAEVIGGIVFALPVSLVLTHLIGGWFWMGRQNMWLFLGVLTVCYFGFHQMCKHILWLKRLFISHREMEEEVEEAAAISFLQQGIHRTREMTGILIFISVFERRVRVLADQGISAKVPKGQWDEIVHIIVDGIKKRSQASAICHAVKEVGRILEEHFPIRPDDRDEIQNLIIKEE